MTVLLLGGGGKLGQALRHELGADHDLHAVGSRDLDCGDPAAVAALIDRLAPAVVINAVVFGGVEACEQDPQRALRVNAYLPRQLARLSRARDFQLIHFSSDAVFSGAKGGAPYREDDIPDPINIYGLTKHLADVFIAEEAERHHLLRVGMVFGDNPKQHQFFEKMVARARQGEALRVADDVITSPTSARDVAALVRRLIAPGCDLPFGLLHAANRGQASLFEFLRFGLDRLGLRPELVPVASAAFPGLGRRTTATPLASATLVARPWQDALAEYCASLHPQSQPEKEA